ncbi:MAG TPA: YggS family pyridoxal phosphate-dependent enzyme [Mycobacteriales bacterium]|nr:YggS family pyridoxal phosphate-dependent enzyme [Mycobacteriales bacterium]
MASENAGPAGADSRAADPRTEELRANLRDVRRRIVTAAEAAGRDPAELTLIAVTKTFPAVDVERLAALGLTDFGENRDGEAREKAAALPGSRWHFIGQLQRNKARSVLSYARVVHSVDRAALVTALQKAAEQADRELDVLLQVSLDPDPAAARGGVSPAGLAELATAVGSSGRLRLRGLMAVPPLGEDPDSAYRRLAEIAVEFTDRHPTAAMLSAGMSHDLESAIQHGATHLRIGTALLGGRPAIVR